MIIAILKVNERSIQILWGLNLIQLLGMGGLFKEKNRKYKIRCRPKKGPVQVSGPEAKSTCEEDKKGRGNNGGGAPSL